MRKSATGIIHYELDGIKHKWEISALWADEDGKGDNEETLRIHLAKHIPKAKFISAEIIPDNEFKK